MAEDQSFLAKVTINNLLKFDYGRMMLTVQVAKLEIKKWRVFFFNPQYQKSTPGKKIIYDFIKIFILIFIKSHIFMMGKELYKGSES